MGKDKTLSSGDNDGGDAERGKRGVPGRGGKDNSPGAVTYKALADVVNDETGKRFKAGATVTADDFPKGVIANWLKIGVLEVKDDGS